MRILTRYLLKQHARPFFFALSALTCFELIRQIARKLGDLMGKGLPWSVILEFFLLTIPFLIAITLSMAVLVAVLYTMSTLSGDRELTAMRAGGVSLGQLLRPLLAAATVVALISFLFGDQILPRTNHRLRSLMTDIYRTKPTFSLKEHVINEVQVGRVMLRTAHIDPGTYLMRDVTLYNLEEAVRNRTVYADSGYLAFAPNQEDLHLTLYDGSIHEFSRDDPRTFQQTDFTRQLILVRGVGSEFVRRETDDYRGDREMGVCQLENVALEARQDRIRLERRAETAKQNGLRALVGLPELPADTAVPMPRRNLYCRALAVVKAWITPPELQAQEAQTDTARMHRPDERYDEGHEGPVVTRPVQLRDRSNEVRLMQERSRTAFTREWVYLVELHKKGSIALACIVFVLVGVPLALRFPRGGMGLVLGAGMAVFAVYYVGLIAGESLANRLVISPFLAMYASNILMGLLGLAGLWVVRRQGITPPPPVPVRLWRRLTRRGAA
jgi:lipopolysaccharide export system permease protein